jgi:hypothetical protein
MKKLLPLSFLAGSVLAAIASPCLAHYGHHSFWQEVRNDVRPFIGVDYQKREMGFQGTFGGEVFDGDFSQYDVYGGIKLFRYLGLSVGYERGDTKDRDYQVGPGSNFLGTILPANNAVESHHSTAEIKGIHFDVMGFWPVLPRWDVEIYGSLGLVHNHLLLSDTIEAADGVAVTDTGVFLSSYDARRTNFRAGLGIQKTFCRHWGVRLSVAWEETSHFDNLKPREFPLSSTNVNANRTFNYGVGVFAVL